MANISTITYNGNVISETEEAGNVAVQYEGRTLATLSAGQTKTFLCNGKVMKTNLYIGAKTLLCAMNQMIADVVVAVKSSFPEAPSYYKLISKYTSSHTWTAPEDGWYQIELHGASGHGGKYAYDQSSDNYSYYYFAGGGGGGGGGTAISRIKMKKGDTVSLSLGTVGSTSSATIKSSLETYTKLQVTSAANGGAGSADADKGTKTAGTGGNGGTASGGNYKNVSGGKGKNGTTASGDAQETAATGGAGGTAATGGNVGGTGGGVRTWANFKTEPTGGSPGCVMIYRGNTNQINGSDGLNVDPILDNNSIAVISQTSKAGLASSYWSVGDFTYIKCPDGYTYRARIMSFDHYTVTNSTSYGRAKTGITFQFDEGHTVTESLSFKYDKGWGGMTTTFFNNLNNRLPSDVLSYVVAAQIPYRTQYYSSTSSYVSNKVFIASHTEIFGSEVYGGACDARWTYYANGASRIKYAITGGTCEWRIRSWHSYSGYSGYVDNVAYINKSGSIAQDAVNKKYVALAFNI